MKFYTELSADECIKRLREKAAPDKGFFSYLNPNPIVCQVSGNQFRMRKNFIRYWHMEWQVRFSGQLWHKGTGTEIEGHVYLSPITGISDTMWKPFFFMWYGALACSALSMLIFSINDLLANGWRWEVVGSLTISLIVMGVFAVFGRIFQLAWEQDRRDEEAELVNFLTSTLQAQRVEPVHLTARRRTHSLQ